MPKKAVTGCLLIIVSLVISFLIFGRLSRYIGFLAYPIIMIGAFGIGKLIEMVFFGDSYFNDDDNK